MDRRDQELRSRWAASGAMALTGDADGPPLIAPAGLVARIAALGDAAGGADALALLAERAAIAGLSRRGRTSCGGATRLLRAAGGWVAVSLARQDDVDLVPAWFGLDTPPPDVWAAVGREVGLRPAAVVVADGRLLGLPVALLGECAGGAGRRPGVLARRLGDAAPLGRPPLVLDLSSLWAGPLCAHLLGLAGARVVKVESTGRADGARRGPATFYDLLHAGHESVALDFGSAAGRSALRRLVGAADVVIAASRPRALVQLGIDAEAAVRDGVRGWVSITGQGRDSDAVSFGDDAAVAGGLVAWTAGDPRTLAGAAPPGPSDAPTPVFVADAIADPLTGLAAAGAVRSTLEGGGRWLLDVSMAHVAADIAGDRATSPASAEPWPPGRDADAPAPIARRPAGRAARHGAHTARVLAELAGGGEGAGEPGEGAGP
ncbi:MAG TPA: CoA transferase [Acidimicrobiales bacterium]|nr:CoA transferase [Acidimicrobiales bacterium]